MILLFGQFVFYGIVLRSNSYKCRLPSEVAFVNVLRHICAHRTFSVRYNMYLSIPCFIYVCFYSFIMLIKELRQVIPKSNG